MKTKETDATKQTNSQSGSTWGAITAIIIALIGGGVSIEVANIKVQTAADKAYAKVSRELRPEIDQIKSDLTKARTSLEANTNELNQLKGDLANTKRNLNELSNQVQTIQAALAAFKRVIGGTVPKSENQIDKHVQFPQPFKKPPIVLVSPVREGSSASVQTVETITEVSEGGFVVISANHELHYKINWVAIEQ